MHAVFVLFFLETTELKDKASKPAPSLLAIKGDTDPTALLATLKKEALNMFKNLLGIFEFYFNHFFLFLILLLHLLSVYNLTIDVCVCFCNKLTWVTQVGQSMILHCWSKVSLTKIHRKKQNKRKQTQF